MRARTFVASLVLTAAAACSSSGGEPDPGGPSRGDTALDAAPDATDGTLDTGEEPDVAVVDTGAPETTGDTGPVSCDPLSLRCSGARDRLQCAETGDAWNPIAACDDAEVCLNGLCVSPCEVPGKYQGSTVGCRFWSVDLGQWHVNEGEIDLDPSASVVPHAVLIGNPGERPATVTFEVTDGTPVDVADPVVPAGEARSFLMPVLSQQDTAVTSQGIHVVSTQPVIASQFNPANNAPGFDLHSTDASLLYPTDMLGTYYVAVSFTSSEGAMGFPSRLGYVTVVATAEGTTTVRIVVTADTAAGPDQPARAAGQRIDVVLERGQVFNVNAAPVPLTATTGGDLTGSTVTADKPVAVFGGHQCAVIVQGNCDHLESQLLPVERWGTRYVAVPFQTPNPTSVYRVLAAQGDTALQTTPSIPGLDGVVLDAREWVEVATPVPFEITGTAPFSVAQFMAGNDEGGAYLVDTSMTVLVPVSQYRSSYPILVPADFAQDRLGIARPTGAAITLNGAPLSAPFTSVGTSGFEVGHIIVDDGVQLLESDVPFGVVSYGFDMKVSYAVPGGMGVEE